MMEIDQLDTTMVGTAVGSPLQNGHGQMGVDPRDLSVVGQYDDRDDKEEDYEEFNEFEDLESNPESENHDPPEPRKPWRPTGCCYDDRMKLHANAEFSEKPAHPEDPRRIEAIMREFKDAGLIYTGPSSELNQILETNPTSWMYRIGARSATIEEICTVHTATHFHWVKDLGSKSSAELRQMTSDMDQGRKSLYVGNLTYEASLISAGGAIETCKNVVEGRVKNAIAVIRPPGHHAEYNESMGFCLFNNVSIAAEICKRDYPDICKKILILDWDVHHGNGIQNIFYDDPNVLYISLHIYQGGQFYPAQPEIEGIPDGGPDKCGRGAGIGRNVNIGWTDQGMGDGEYMAAFQRIVMPIAQEFSPDLVIVAAGFDAAAGDELGGCFVTPPCYAHMTHMLMSLADGKIAVCLEGGYNLRAISRSALAVAKTLMGDPPPRIQIQPLNSEANQVLEEVKVYQSPYWDCMRLDPREKANDAKEIIKEVRDLKGLRLNEIIRGYQKKVLSTNHKMISLYVMREKISRQFQDQVLVTQNLQDAKRIFCIIHDP
jgi:histone deacetylase 6